MIHNALVQQVETIAIKADELWSFIQKNKNNVCLGSLRWATAPIGLSQAKDSGLILASRVGKHTDELIEKLVTSTEGKTDCQQWDTDGWGGYERVLPPEVKNCIGKERTQRLERTNGIVRQQTVRWHRTSEQIW